MNVYVDTSVVLRALLGQPGQVEQWARWERAYISELVRTEFFRTVDRLRLEGQINDDDRAQVANEFARFSSTCFRMPVDSRVLNRAAAPFPTVLGTLDAIHLSSTLLLEEHLGTPLTLLTHERQLARAAVASGIQTAGVSL